MSEQELDATLPFAGRGDDAVQGHWLLARLGKRVLRRAQGRRGLELIAAERVTEPTRIAQAVRRTGGKWVGETYRR